SGRVGSEKDSDISVSRSCWLNCDTTIIPLDQDLFVHYLYSGYVAWSASHGRCHHRLTSKNRRSRVAAGDATCVSSPTLQELISGLFHPVLWMPGRNKNVGESSPTAPASRNSSSSFNSSVVGARHPRYCAASRR